MLVSHRKHFIFTKTLKTAGTSIESYFEQYCMPDGEWQKSHHRDEYVSEAGVIGYRGSGSAATWYNHMSAERIRARITQDVWDRYFKFTVVRNPFDKLISGFFMLKAAKPKHRYRQRWEAVTRRLWSRGNVIDREGNTHIEQFRGWVRAGAARALVDRDKYLIDGQESVDYFIRFEHLLDGMQVVCDRLSLPFDPSRIPEFKKGHRHHRISLRDYYDRPTRQIVEEMYAWELDRFGYGLPK